MAMPLTYSPSNSPSNSRRATVFEPQPPQPKTRMRGCRDFSSVLSSGSVSVTIGAAGDSSPSRSSRTRSIRCFIALAAARAKDNHSPPLRPRHTGFPKENGLPLGRMSSIHGLSDSVGCPSTAAGYGSFHVLFGRNLVSCGVSFAARFRRVCFNRREAACGSQRI